MRRTLCVLALAALGCGASTELDDFSEGVPADAGRMDAFDAFAPPGPGELLTLISGNTASDGTRWGRPFSCDDFSSGAEHAYSVVSFENPLPVDLFVTIEVQWSFDGFLHVYENFDPSDTRSNCIDANDDWTDTRSSRLAGIRVPAGEQIDMVLSSFSPGNSGTYELFVTAE